MPPITFAHRGARLAAAENTIEAFRIALDQGAAGLETDAWLNAEREVVLTHDDRIRRGLRRHRVQRSTSDSLAEIGVPTLRALYEALGDDYELSIDLKDPEAAAPILAVSQERGHLDRLWLCSPSIDVLTDLVGCGAHTVHSTSKEALDSPIERHAAHIAAVGVEVMNMHHTEWTAGIVSLFHRFGLRAFAWDAQEARHIRRCLRIGVDGIYCDRPDRLVATVAEWSASPLRPGDSEEPDA